MSRQDTHVAPAPTSKPPAPTHGLISVQARPAGPPIESHSTAIDVEHMSFFYGPNQALFDISVKLPAKLVTAFIGPSGLRQEHVPAHDEPDERHHPGFAGRPERS
jgi:ABC-type multidrug transport system fused ATPase/permease subunit